MQNLQSPTHFYPYEEFCEDLGLTTRVRLPQLVALLVQRYPDKTVRDWRAARLIAAGKYLLKHRAKLNRGSLAVFGENNGIITGRVTIVLWQHWARPEVDPKTYDPPISEFVHMCENLPGDKLSGESSALK